MVSLVALVLALVPMCGGGLRLQSDLADLDAQQPGFEPPRSTLLLVVGLEGTGHKYMDTVMNVLSSKKTDFACHADLLKGSWNQWAMMREDHSWSPLDLDMNVEYLKEVAERCAGKLIHIQYTVTGAYPDGQGTHEQRMTKRQPDIVLLQEACQKAGVSLKVLMTNRPAAALLAANCVHRHDLEQCGPQAETLRANAMVMMTQVHELMQLSPGAVRCLPFGDLNMVGEGIAAAVADPEVKAIAERAARDSWNPRHQGGPALREVSEHAPRIPEAELTSLCESPGVRADAVASLRHILPESVKSRPAFDMYMKKLQGTI